MHIKSTLLFFLFLVWSSLVYSLDQDTVKKTKENNIDSNSDIELILSVRVQNLILGDIFGYKNKSKILVGLKGLSDILNFPINVNVNKLSAQGWYINKDNIFSLTPSDLSKTVAKLSTNLTSQSFSGDDVKQDDDIYLNIDGLFMAMGFQYKVNLNDLTLEIIPPEPLPIQQKIARQKKRPAQSHSSVAILPQKHIPYRAFSPPFVDFQSQVTKIGTGTSNRSYSALGAGDLAFMTGTYYVNGNDNFPVRNFRLTLSKNSLNNKLLGPLKASFFSFGDIKPTPIYGLNSPQEVGARITNRPQGQATLYNQTDFTGDTQPGWDVELYRNSLFLGVQTVGENGRYEFYNQNLLYGENTFRLIFYGPQGEKKEETKKITLDKNTIGKKNTLYDISLSKQKQSLFNPSGINKSEDKYRRLAINLSHNIDNFSTMQLGFTRYTFYNGIRHIFLQSNLSLNLFNTLLNFNLTKDIRAGEAYNFGLTRSLGINAKHVIAFSRTVQTSDYRRNSNTSATPIDSSKFTLSGALLSFSNLGYSLKGNNSNYSKNSTSNKLGLSLSAGLGKFKASNNLDYTQFNSPDKQTIRSILGIANISTSIKTLNFRSGINYTLTPEKKTASLKTEKGIRSITTITRLDGAMAWYINSDIKVQISTGYLPSTDTFTKRLSLSWKAKHITLISNLNYIDSNSFLVYFGINFSMGYDRETSQFKLTSDRMARSGAITAMVFSDENNNGIHDNNEELHENVKINATQSRKTITTNQTGQAFLSGLRSDRITDIRLDEDSIDDPFLVPTVSSFSFLPRPGLVQQMKIPLVISGEVEGTVVFENKNGNTQNAGYITLTLTNIKTREERSTISAYDGFYLFSNIPPGEYLVGINRSYLKQNKLSAKKPMPRIVTIHHTGNIAMGANFTIFPIEE